VAWYNTTTSNTGTKTAGLLLPNALGIYDMSGNISEWCWDIYDSYANLLNVPGNDNNPRGALGGTERVRRGGSWNNAVGNVRSVIRNSDTRETATWVIGFRLARSPDMSQLW
jgi:formylglycine-generating enzyme required for sulfatase activity